MTSGVGRGNSDCIFGSDSGRFLKNAVTNLAFDLLDLLNRLLFTQSIDEEIDVRGWRQLLMIVVSKRAFRFVMWGLVIE
jgi:hypothetical protein